MTTHRRDDFPLKKLFAIVLALILSTSVVGYAAEYRYFNSSEMTVEIDTSSIVVLNGSAYATDRQGNLYVTQIFYDWILIGHAPKNCKIISTNHKNDHKLLVLSENTLYVTYDGYAFYNVETFAEGSVIQYINGIYVAASKTDNNYKLRYSFDGLTWYDFKENFTSAAISVLQVNETTFLLKNLQTKAGVVDFSLSSTTPGSYATHEFVTYDYRTNSLTTTQDDSALLYATKTSENLFLYVLHNNGKYELVRIDGNRALLSTSTLVADDSYELYILNNTVCLAKAGQSLNLINTADATWHQVNNDIAFPLLKNAYGLCGDVFFDGGYTSTYFCQNTATMPIAASGIEVMLNGDYLAFDSAPQLINDRTMVPIRAIAEALDCTITYDSATRGIHIQRSNGISLYMTIGYNIATIVWGDGVSADIPLDSAPVIVNDRTLVPLRFISESLELNVNWVAETQTVVLN